MRRRADEERRLVVGRRVALAVGDLGDDDLEPKVGERGRQRREDDHQEAEAGTREPATMPSSVCSCLTIRMMRTSAAGDEHHHDQEPVGDTRLELLRVVDLQRSPVHLRRLRRGVGGHLDALGRGAAQDGRRLAVGVVQLEQGVLVLLVLEDDEGVARREVGLVVDLVELVEDLVHVLAQLLVVLCDRVVCVVHLEARRLRHVRHLLVHCHLRPLRDLSQAAEDVRHARALEAAARCVAAARRRAVAAVVASAGWTLTVLRRMRPCRFCAR